MHPLHRVVGLGKPRPGARLRMSDAPLAGARKRQAGQARKKRKAS